MRSATTSIRDKYTYRVTWSDEDNEYVGLCTEFPSLSWLASTRDEALHGVEALVRDVVADVKSRGESVPEPMAAHDFSGTFKVRIPAVQTGVVDMSQPGGFETMHDIFRDRRPGSAVECFASSSNGS
jgi:predicted RNase H-like HicB family nuclease